MSNAPGPAPARDETATPPERRRVIERPQRRALALTPRPILTLDTIAPERPTIRIDGLDYRLPLYEDFALWQHSRLAKLTRRAGELDAIALTGEQEPTDDDWAELDHLALDLHGEIVAVLLPDVPAPTRHALTLAQREAIVREFFAHNQSRSAGPQQAASAAPPTGGPSSPPSPAASGTGAGGRGKRRSASSSPPTAP
jgi:hypothetical protein